MAWMSQSTNHKEKLASQRYHFVGIGGIGMCGLAQLLHEMGAEVTGSDLAQNQQTQRLQNLGVSVFSEHRAENVGDADVLVYSSAIPDQHVERLEAQKRKIPQIARAEVLGELMRLKRGIAIAGTHGKTTTTSLMTSVLFAAQQDPSAVVGGHLALLDSTATWGQGSWMVVEADESDGSFSKLFPEIVVLTNIDDDHLDFYGDINSLKKAFLNFASQIPFYGQVIACGDDPLIRETFSNFDKRILYYGFDEKNDYQVVEGQKEFFLLYQKKKIAKLNISLPGRHNILNAAATLSIANELQLPLELSVLGVESFSGVGRRADYKGEKNGVEVYDDYAHHPTEIQLTIQGFKEKFSDKKLIVCFQPHRYSRTKSCWSQFLKVFHESDELWMQEIYPAGEKPISGVSSDELLSQIKHPCAKKYSQSLLKNLSSGTVFLTMGAGDVWKVGESFLNED